MEAAGWYVLFAARATHGCTAGQVSAPNLMQKSVSGQGQSGLSMSIVSTAGQVGAPGSAQSSEYWQGRPDRAGLRAPVLRALLARVTAGWYLSSLPGLRPRAPCTWARNSFGTAPVLFMNSSKFSCAHTVVSWRY